MRFIHWIRGLRLPAGRRPPTPAPRLNLVHLEDCVTPADFRDVGGLRFAVDDVFGQLGDTAITLSPVRVGVTPTGGNPFVSLLTASGVTLNTNPATPSAKPFSAVTVGGVTFNGFDFAFGFATPGRSTLSGTGTAQVGGINLSTTFGPPGGPAPGLVIENGKLAAVDLGFTSDFTADGVTFDADALRFKLDTAAGNRFAVTGPAAATFTNEFETVSVTAQFGASAQKPGLVVVNGQLSELTVGVTGGFAFGALGVTASDLTFQLNDAQNTFSLSGSAAATFKAAGVTSTLGLTFGTVPQPGLVVRNGEVESVNARVNGGFAVGGVTITATDLRLTTPGAGGDVFDVSGAATAAFTAGGSPAALTVDLGTPAAAGLRIVSGSLRTLNLGVTGGFRLAGLDVQSNDLRFVFNRTTSLFALSGSAGAKFSAGGSTVGLAANLGTAQAPGVVVQNGQLQSLNAGVTGGFNLDGVSVTADGLALAFDRATGSYALSGKAGATFTAAGKPVALALDLGTPAAPGLRVAGGQLTNVNAGVTTDFAVGGLSLRTKAQTVTFDRAAGTFGLSGSAGAEFKQGTATVALDTQFGSPTAPGLVIRDGRLQSLAVGVTGGFKVAGLQFGTDALTLTFDSPTNRYTLSGGTTATFSGGGAMVDLGVRFGDAAAPGLVVTNGSLTRLDLAVTSDFTVARVNVRTKALRFTFDSPTNTYTLGGTAGLSFTGAGSTKIDFDVTFGGSNRPGLVITDGTLQRLEVGVTGGFNVAGLEAKATDLMFGFNRNDNSYALSGGVAISTKADGRGRRMLNNVGVVFGDRTGPGLLVRDGALERLNFEVTGKIDLASLSATARGLRVRFERATGVLQFTGGIDVSLAGRFNGSVDLPNGGLTINTSTGAVRLGGLRIALNNTRLGPVNIIEAFVQYTDDNKGSFNLSAGGLVNLPSGLQVGGGFEFESGQLKSIRIAAAKSNPGFQLGTTPVFVNRIDASLENLNDPRNLRLAGSVTISAGGRYTLGGRTVSLLQGTAGIALDVGAGTLTIDGKLSLIGDAIPLANAKLVVSFDVNAPAFVTSVKATARVDLLNGFVTAGLDVDIMAGGDTTISAFAKITVPDIIVPATFITPSFNVGGQVLAQASVTIFLNASDPRFSFVSVSVPINLIAVGFQANLRYRFDGQLTVNGQITRFIGIPLPGGGITVANFTLPLPALVSAVPAAPDPEPPPPPAKPFPEYVPTVRVLSSRRENETSRQLLVTFQASTVDATLETTVEAALNDQPFGTAGRFTLLDAARQRNRMTYDPVTGVGSFFIPDPELSLPPDRPFTVRLRIMDPFDAGLSPPSDPIPARPSDPVLTSPPTLIVVPGSSQPFASDRNRLTLSDPTSPNDPSIPVAFTIEAVRSTAVPSFDVTFPLPSGVSRRLLGRGIELSGPLGGVNEAIRQLRFDRTDPQSEETFRVTVGRPFAAQVAFARELSVPPVSAVRADFPNAQASYTTGQPAVPAFSGAAGRTRIVNQSGLRLTGARISIIGFQNDFGEETLSAPGLAAPGPFDGPFSTVPLAQYFADRGMLVIRGFSSDQELEDALNTVLFSTTLFTPTRTLAVQFTTFFGQANVGAPIARTVAVTRGSQLRAGLVAAAALTEATGPMVDAGLVIGTYTGDGPVPILSDLLASTPGPDRLTTATVAFTGPFDATSDVLAFTRTGGLTGRFDPAAGVLSLTAGPDTTTADFETALRGVTFTSTRKNPVAFERQVTVTLTDAAVVSTPPVVGTTFVRMDVPAVPPGMTATTKLMTFPPNGDPLAVFPDAVLVYPDADLPPPTVTTGPWVVGSRITRASVAVSTNYVRGEDVLTFTPVAGITGRFLPETGELLLDGLAPLADYQRVLRSVRYQNVNTSPSTLDREIVATLDDGTASGTPPTARRVVRPQSDGMSTVRVSGPLMPVTVSPVNPETPLGLADLTYAPRPGETALVYTILNTPTSMLGTVRLADGTVAADGMEVTIEQLRGATFVAPAVPTAGTVEFQFSIAGVNPVTGVPTDTPLVATVPIVTANGDPTAAADVVDVPAGGPLTLAVLDNDTDPNRDVLGVEAFTQPANGTVAQSETGKLVYTPNPGFAGTDTFEYTVIDGAGGRSTAPVTLTVTAPGGRAALVGARQFAAGTDRGAATVTLFDPDGSTRFAVTPFGDFTGGVRTAAADFNGDGVADLVVGTGPGRATRVVVLDGKTQAELFAVDPFEPEFTGGVYVTAGDLNGDGTPDLVITPDEGGGPRVDVFSGAGFTKMASFFGIDDPNFRGGARASTGDINGDGTADLIVVAGFGGGPRVAGFEGKSVAATPARLFGDFFAFETDLRNGVFVTAGDLDGDGFAELIAGGGPGGGPRVTAFGGKALLDNVQDVRANFFGGDTASRGGIRLAVKDLDGDDRADLVVGAGSGAGSKLTAYRGRDIAPAGTPPAALDFDAFAGFPGGVFVG